MPPRVSRREGWAGRAPFVPPSAFLCHPSPRAAPPAPCRSRSHLRTPGPRPPFSPGRPAPLPPGSSGSAAPPRGHGGEAEPRGAPSLRVPEAVPSAFVVLKVPCSNRAASRNAFRGPQSCTRDFAPRKSRRGVAAVAHRVTQRLGSSICSHALLKRTARFLPANAPHNRAERAPLCSAEGIPGTARRTEHRSPGPAISPPPAQPYGGRRLRPSQCARAAARPPSAAIGDGDGRGGTEPRRGAGPSGRRPMGGGRG